jgi:uncharacterized protein YbcV (DUF1398 family)
MIPFLEQCKILRDQAGVRYYEVNVSTQTTQFVGEKDVFREHITGSFDINATFSELFLKKALESRRLKKTSYSEFLQQIAKAGVISYQVDMRTNTVTYSGNGQSYSEIIPLNQIKN